MKKLFLRTILTYLFIIITILGVKAQTWDWAKSGNGTLTDESLGGICTDVSGNIYITGDFESPTITFGSYTLTNTGTSNVFLAKYDASGNVIWAKSSIGSGQDAGYSVGADVNGNVYVTGIFTSPTIVFGSYTLSNIGIQSIFLAKYDANGNVLWAKSSVGSQIDNSNSVCTDANAYITGGFGSPTITFGSYTLTNTGGYNVFLAKYDSNGNVLWAKSANGSGYGYSASADVNGNVFVTGFFGSPTIIFGSYTLTLSSNGNGDIFLVKYDANGNVLWAKSSNCSGGTGDYGYSVSTDAGGNAFITGVFTSSVIAFDSYTLTNSEGNNDNGLTNVLIAKYDANGNALWAKNPKGKGTAWWASSNPNSVYISGSLTDTLIIDTYTLIPPVGSPDPMFIARYDSNGNATYATYFTSGGDDFNGIAVDKSCNVYITGDFQGNLSIGTNTLIPTGGENIFIAKLSIPQPTVTVSSSSVLICVNQSATLSASGASTYSWNPSNVGGTIVISPTITSTYTVTGTSTITGCQNSASITESINICEGIKEFNSNNNQINVYPNPNNGSFKIKIENEIQDGDLILLNSLGQKVHEQKIFRGENNIITKNISSGLYQYLILQNKQRVGNGKLIIE